jgi:NitT/TauT family transport system substrate-binding protein
MRNIRAWGVLAVLGALLTAPVAAQAPPALTVIRVASNAADDVTPILYAQKTGMFAKAGLDVDLQKFNSGAAVTAAVVGGAIDIGKSSIIPLINAHVHGVPIRIIASGELWLTAEPISGMIVKKDGPINTARDLTGKTVAVVALGDLTHTGARAWLDETGGNSKSVHYLELPSSAVLAALNDGRIDAANVSNPVFTQIVASGQVRIIGRPSDAIAKRYLVTGFFATDGYLAKNGDAVLKFVQVLRAAAAYTNTHHAETLAMTAAFWGIDPGALAAMTRASVGLTVEPREIQPVIDAAVKYGVIEEKFDARDLIAPLVRKTP